MKILTALRVGIAWISLLLASPKLIRFFIPWFASLTLRSSPLKDKNPWITFEAKKWLESFLTRNMTVFEYGSGGSTIFISKRIKKLISVEHDRDWHQFVSQILYENNISNCKYLLVEPELDPPTIKLYMDPKSYASGSPEYENMSFENYVKSIESFPYESFDLVVIDGRARPSCILHALSKVRLGGFLMLDNSERSEYHRGMDILREWKRTDFFGPGPYGTFWQTSVWKKPVHKKKRDDEKYEQN